ncbi:hypothetical protein BUALT_Bualt13G0105800 [Buddleja alternifolia]|uniref:Uncharacterized protein n=1 Tax=Buddleja alternifolia TaxID=168488 RepID=A0AAV6WKJ8_9LAMI|nr:hypothetical protein BUALT_Bualt13G0105800 [Buddleja alternifolia]
MLASTALNLSSFGTLLTHNPPLLLPQTKTNNKTFFFKSQNSITWKFTKSVKTSVTPVDSPHHTQKEHFKEQLYERLRYYGERNIEQDFWLVIEPKFLEKFPNVTKRLRRPAVALVSTNGTWITFMKLRLDRVLQESFEADSLQEALASKLDSNLVNLEFGKPKKWTAPYPKYEFGWWEPFLPPKTSKV